MPEGRQALWLVHLGSRVRRSGPRNCCFRWSMLAEEWGCSVFSDELWFHWLCFADYLLGGSHRFEVWVQVPGRHIQQDFLGSLSSQTGNKHQEWVLFSCFCAAILCFFFRFVRCR